MTRKIPKYIVPILLLVLTSCYSVKPLEFQKAENVTVNYIGGDPQIKFNITGHNPNNWGFRLSELKLNINIDGVSNAGIELDSVMRLNGNSDFSIPASLKTSQHDLSKILSSGIASFLSGNKIPLEIKGDFTLKKFLFRKKFSFQLREEIDPKTLR